ncbi:cystatin-like [Lissotriton helveticus]
MLGAWQVSILAIVVLGTSVPAVSSGKPGGWFDVDPQDKGLQKALTFAMQEYNEGSNDMYRRQIMTITKARKQIISGAKYEAKVVTGLTLCLKTDPENQDCSFQESLELLKRSTCTFIVETVPWLKKTELKKKRCQ